uniref:pyrroloquinoline quinone biosynthesis peptide chaperone PqqD n=1 Tax=Marinobacterium profundum TaxID=1714300 RepID=UPI0009EC9EE7|nr:pyrroloquinoline quinone biosynthesis peptide chaperone PqqD [Marinobacterium profundum]
MNDLLTHELGLKALLVEAQRVPAFNPMFRLQWEKAQDSYVLLYPEGMIKLNPSAGEILARVDGKQSEAEITDALQQAFPEAGSLAGDVHEFMEVACEQNWIRFV